VAYLWLYSANVFSIEINISIAIIWVDYPVIQRTLVLVNSCYCGDFDIVILEILLNNSYTIWDLMLN